MKFTKNQFIILSIFIAGMLFQSVLSSTQTFAHNDSSGREVRALEEIARSTKGIERNCR